MVQLDAVEAEGVDLGAGGDRCNNAVTAWPGAMALFGNRTGDDWAKG